MIDLNGSLDWEPFDIPGGTAPVSLVRLHAEPSRAFTVAVRFPAGWSRPEPGGWYEAAEDVVFLRGILSIGDDTFGAWDWAHLPARYPRPVSVARTEVLAVARFSGPARWVPGLAGAGADARERRALADAGPPVASPIGEAVLLRAGHPDTAWLSAGPAGLPVAPVDTQLLDLGALRWAFVVAGDPLPAFDGPCFCRTVVRDKEVES